MITFSTDSKLCLKFKFSLHIADINVFSVPSPQFPVGVLIGVVTVLLLLVCVVGFFIWKRNNNGKIKNSIYNIYCVLEYL